MNAFDNVFPIGLGTARFPFLRPETYHEDFEDAVNLVLYALNKGVNYIDVGKGYSTNKAFSVLKEAFRRTDKDYYVSLKVNAFDQKSTAQDYYDEALFVLSEMGLTEASHFLLWTLMDSPHFHNAVKKDGLYDAAVRLRDEGKVRHIGTSVHMRYDDIIEVINSGLFEFVLVSYNLLNFFDMQRVLDCAYEKDVDILVMNPLYGGLIPENEDLFQYAKFLEHETVVQAAIRAVLSHPAVKCVLAGASDREQLDEYLLAVALPEFDAQNKIDRAQAIKEHTVGSRTFCSYCRYCIDCPKKIPVSQIMNAHNIFSLQDKKSDNSSEKIFFRLMHEKFDIGFDTSENPCIKCGQCEKKCTQHLNIIESIDEVYRMVDKTCYDKASRKKRFNELLNGKGYQNIGFWPASAGTIKILDIYKELFGEIPFEVLLFDSNTDYHGKERFGYLVHSKSEAKQLGVDCILITSYQYGDVIREEIKEVEELGIPIKLLYNKAIDVDWWW